METISTALRSIYNLISNGHVDNALWEVKELEEYLNQSAPHLIEKYHMKRYFIRWRNQLMRNRIQTQNLSPVLEEIELLANKLDHIVLY